MVTLVLKLTLFYTLCNSRMSRLFGRFFFNMYTANELAYLSICLKISNGLISWLSNSFNHTESNQ